MFRCPGWVTSSRVFSTETVDYVFINENGNIANFPNG